MGLYVSLNLFKIFVNLWLKSFILSFGAIEKAKSYAIRDLGVLSSPNLSKKLGLEIIPIMNGSYMKIKVPS